MTRLYGMCIFTKNGAEEPKYYKIEMITLLWSKTN